MTSGNDHSSAPPARHRLGLIGLHPRQGWELHPGVRSDNRAARRDRVAYWARDLLGSWSFAAVVVAVVCAGIVPAAGKDDADVAVLLAAVLSGLGVVELSVVLMTARRLDEITSDVALYDVDSGRRAAAAIEDLRREVERLRGDLARLTARLQTSGSTLDQSGEK